MATTTTGTTSTRTTGVCTLTYVLKILALVVFVAQNMYIVSQYSGSFLSPQVKTSQAQPQRQISATVDVNNISIISSDATPISIPEAIVEEESDCTVAEAIFQADNYCSIFGGRHNLVDMFTLIRFHLPNAQTLIDIGANKGLVSARWFELWRPSWNVTSLAYARQVVKPYFLKHNKTKEAGNECGVTSMCSNAPDAFQRQALDQFAPIRRGGTKDPLRIHSFEPSHHLYDLHVEYLGTEGAVTSDRSTRLSEHWQWHRIAASDFDGGVYFEALWHEGSSLKRLNGQKEPNTRSATLDVLAYQDGLFTAHNESTNNLMIDVLKIDAETVDAKVLAGASRLLAEGRIRVVMWETPNDFPLHFPAWFAIGSSPPLDEKSNGEKHAVPNFGSLIELLNQRAGMTCYFPGTDYRVLRTTGTTCWDALAKAPKCKNRNCPHGAGCPVVHSNALCVNRKEAPALYQALEASSLLHP